MRSSGAPLCKTKTYKAYRPFWLLITEKKKTTPFYLWHDVIILTTERTPTRDLPTSLSTVHYFSHNVLASLYCATGGSRWAHLFSFPIILSVNGVSSKRKLQNSPPELTFSNIIGYSKCNRHVWLFSTLFFWRSTQRSWSIDRQNR